MSVLKMKYICLISCLLFASQCVSNDHIFEKPIRWVTDTWPNYTEQDGSGLYHDLMRAIFHKNKEFNVNYAPWLRSLELVKSGGADLTGAMPLNAAYIMSQHVVLSQPISILVRKDQKHLISQRNLSSFAGVWRSGYYNELLDDELKKHVKGVATENADSGFNLVRHKRVDYFIDVRTILSTHLAKQADREDFTLIDISHLNLYMAFSNDERGRKVAALFDQRFSQLTATGKLQEIYAKYDLQQPNQQQF